MRDDKENCLVRESLQILSVLAKNYSRVFKVCSFFQILELCITCHMQSIYNGKLCETIKLIQLINSQKEVIFSWALLLC